MWIGLILAAFLGLMSVLQGGLNRLISQKMGLHITLITNAIIFLAVPLIVFILKSFFFSEHKSLTSQQLWILWISQHQWWWYFPGVFGVILVFGIPIQFEKYGALSTMVGLISAQLIGGFFWDYWIEEKNFNLWHMLACTLILVSCVLITIADQK
jgi:uncharacterized membrane protein YdcZ (DUF606 family)